MVSDDKDRYNNGHSVEAYMKFIQIVCYFVNADVMTSTDSWNPDRIL